MAGERRLPPVEELVELRAVDPDTGKPRFTYAQIAEMFGVSRNAVYLQLASYAPADPADAPITPRPVHRLRPPRVAAIHDQAPPADLLRLYNRHLNGETLPPGKQRRLDRWLAELREQKLVLCYDPDQPPNPASPVSGGWFYDRRRRSDGDNVTRFGVEQDVT